VENLTHSHQKLDGSLAIKLLFGPQAQYSISFSLTPSIRVKRAWKCHTELLILAYRTEEVSDISGLPQAQQSLKSDCEQHQWPEV